MVEFSPATASAMGLAWTHHEDCRAAMEADFLPALFRHARDVARCSAPAASEAGADAAGVCGAAVSLLCAVLLWDFRRARWLQTPILLGGAPSMAARAAVFQRCMHNIVHNDAANAAKACLFFVEDRVPARAHHSLLTGQHAEHGQAACRAGMRTRHCQHTAAGGRAAMAYRQGS